MSVFVSWTGRDRDVKNVLVEALRNEQIQYWDSDEECTSDYSSECIRAIDRCQVFIVIVSEASMQEGYVKNEIIHARKLEGKGKLNIIVYKITDAPYSDDFEFQLNHISFASGNLIQQKQTVGGTSGIDTVLKRTKRLLQRRRDGDPEKPFEVAVPQVDGLELTRTGYFVENSRDETFRLIDDAFRISNVVVLTELFGFGKRSTVRKYAELRRKLYDSVLLVRNDRGSLRDFFLVDLSFRNLNERTFEALEGNDLIQAKLRQLEKLDEKTLLVIPDVRLEDEPDRFLWDRLSQLKCRILLLAEESADRYDDIPVISLGRMTDANLLELFFHHYSYTDEEERETLNRPLQQFFTNIGGHTRTVELTAAVLSRDLGAAPVDIPGYLSLAGTEGVQLKDRIIRQISSLMDMEKLSREELTVLLAAALLAVRPMAREDFRSVLQKCGITDWTTVVELDRRRWLDVDLRERTVTMEPLIAQVMLSKLPEDYTVPAQCLDCIAVRDYGKLLYANSQRPTLQFLGRMEHLLRATGLDVMAEIVSLMMQSIIEEAYFDQERLAEAIGNFTQQYGSADADKMPESEGPICRAQFEQQAAEYLRSTILPLAKILSNELAQLLYNFDMAENQGLTQSLQSAGNQLIESVFNFSREELWEQIAELRESFNEFAAAQEDEEDGEFYEAIVWVELAAAIDALYDRNFVELMRCVDSVLERVLQMPELLTDSAAAFYSILATVANCFLNARAYRAAAQFSRKVMAVETPAVERGLIVKSCVIALRNGEEYTDELFAAYEELFGRYGQLLGISFESRGEQLTEKKEWRLMYAADLAAAGKLREAEAQFQAAVKLGKDFIPAQTLHTAEKLADAWINTGSFEEALAFIRRYYDSGVRQQLRGIEDEAAREILDRFGDLDDLTDHVRSAFSSPQEPEKHVSYYHDFLQENNKGAVGKYETVAARAMQFDFSELSDDALAKHADTLRQRAKREKPLALAPEAFALVSEAGRRVLGYRHHRVQYLGAAVMADDRIAEILNGEGKTYTIPLTAFLHHLYSKKVFIIDASKYLTRRNYYWMHGVFDLLGVSCGLLLNTRDVLQDSYRQADVTYANLDSLMLGVLHWELKMQAKRSALCLDCAIVDEIDSVLVDSAQHSYRITAAENRNLQSVMRLYQRVYQIACEVAYQEEYYTCQNKRVTLKSGIIPLIERHFGLSYQDVASLERIRQIEDLICTAILCTSHYEKGVDYFIEQGRPVWEEKNKGTFREFSPQYRYFLCRANDLDWQEIYRDLQKETVILNATCVRDLFRRFSTVCGTTATAVSYRKEFQEIYELGYVSIPPTLPCIRQDLQSPIYMRKASKEKAILALVQEKHSKHQPVLLISGSISESERYAALLRQAGVSCHLLNARNVSESSDLIAEAGVSDSVLVTTALVNRGVDIKLGGNPELRTRKELVHLGMPISEELLYSAPGKEQTGAERRYHSILEKNRALAERDRRTVIAAGGLCVIGTSFFDEPRTEQQVRGRSGRQGEVGESWVFRSLEDECIQKLMPGSTLEWVMHLVGDNETLDGRMLEKSMKAGRQRLHESQFAAIRKCNNTSWYIERARKDFIGRKFDLAEGNLRLEDVLRIWAGDKEILKQLSTLQKGERSNASPLLMELYDRNRGLRKERELYEALCAELNAFSKAASEQKSAAMAAILKRITTTQLTKEFNTLLLDYWKRYIDFTNKLLEVETMTERTLARQLTAEKDRLLRECVEVFMMKLLRKKGA